MSAAIKALHANGIIDDRLKEWAEALRKDGNLAAHDPNTTMSAEDASDLIDFTEALLEYVFVLHQKFQAFTARRAVQGKPAQPEESGDSDADSDTTPEA